MEQDEFLKEEERDSANTRRPWTCVEVLGLFCPILLLWRLWNFCQSRRNGCRYKRPRHKYELDEETDLKLAQTKNELHQQREETTRLQGQIDELEKERDAMKHTIDQKDKHIGQLHHEKETIEKEKDDALNRLSQLVSVQLRDNNPNIVDLNDPYRPTKLAEMFSELYDNEWTAAFTAMEEQFEPEQIVSFLLDVVMESYAFCNDKAQSSWSFVTHWFLPEGMHNAQGLRKALKDGQKLQAQNMVSNLQTEFCQHLTKKCVINDLRGAFSKKEVAKYIHLCVKICFLMAVNDPAVIIECPNRGNPGIKFNKEEFKEYTSRGPYMTYHVWPLIRLYVGGPLLGKGVAQGGNEPATRDQGAWKWNK